MTARYSARRPSPRTVGRRRRGVGLVELLVALSISAALLTAVGVAVDASFKAYRVNQEQSDLMQRARVGMHRMVTLIRQTKEHAPEGEAEYEWFTNGVTVTDTGIQMMDLSDKAVAFRYEADRKRVVAVRGGVAHPLVTGVEAFEVTLEPMRSATSIKTGEAWDLMRRATILMTIRGGPASTLPGEGTGGQTVTLSASVMPRRNTW